MAELTKFHKYIHNTFASNISQENATSIKSITQVYNIMLNKWLVQYIGDISQSSANSDSDDKTLNMAKKVCEDIADMELNEDWSISCDDEDAKLFIEAILEKNNFDVRANWLIDITNGLGTGAFVEYIDGEKIVIDYIRGDMVLPLVVENGTIKAVATVSIDKVGDEEICQATVFTQTHIQNIRAKVNEDGNVDVEQCDEQGKYADGTEAISEVLYPTYQIITPNTVNPIDMDCGLGMSRFSKSTDALEAINRCFETFNSEFETGRKRIFINNALTSIKKIGEKFEKLFNKKKSLFYDVDMGDNNKPIETFDPVLRVEEHKAGLQEFLSVLGMQCGLGSDFYTHTNGVIKTATEVDSINNKTVRTVKKDELIIKRALQDLSKSILGLANQYLGGNFDLKQDIKIHFDNSIFVNEEQQRTAAQSEVGIGVMSKVEYRMKIYGETEEDATEAISEIQDSEPQTEMLIME